MEINPFRWKGFYYDAESGFYYANGSYYDPETGSYLDAAPISAALENAYSPRRLDRNGIMCDNILELAGNSFTADTDVALATDPNYDGTVPLSWLGQAIQSVVRWFHGLSNTEKAIIGCALFAVSLLLAVATGGVSAAIQVTVEVAIGVGVGIGIWALSTLAMGQQLTVDGLAQAALDSFVVSSLFAFVSQSINAIKAVARSTNYVASTESTSDLAKYELDPRSIELAKQGNPSWGTFRKRVWRNEANFRPELYKGNYGRMSLGLAPKVGGKSMHLHHVVGKANDMYNVIKVTQAQHVAIHKAIGYHYNAMWTLENAVKYGGLG